MNEDLIRRLRDAENDPLITRYMDAATLLEAADALEAMQWRNMDSAPKNPSGEVSGPPVLLWNDYSHQIIRGFWTTAVANGSLQTGWFIWAPVEAKYTINPQHKITGWLPLDALPTPPEEEK